MDTTTTINRINELIEIVPGKIRLLPAGEFDLKSSTEKWSKKEILGHLCDSAINNLSRFIRAQFEPKPFAVNRYDQDVWVKACAYQQVPQEEILALWISLNKQIVNVIKQYTAEMLSYECYLEGGEFSNYTAAEKSGYTSTGGKRTLYWLIDDYAAHMEYHLHQIIEY
jgi:hypothetical protein